MTIEDFDKEPKYDYDIALSFSGDEREYVEEIAIMLRGYGVKVFYDKFEESSLWGKNLYDYLSDIYKNKAKYTVMFISKSYKDKAWTNHERMSMQERAFNDSKDYILPARFDDTEIPGLRETTGYIDLKYKKPSDLVELILKKLNYEKFNRWWGWWNLNSVIPTYQGSIFIKSVSNKGFLFELSNTNGAHSGTVKGVAKFSTTNTAIFRSDEDESLGDTVCEIEFQRFNDVIQVNEGHGCHYFHGMRSHFNGEYNLKKDILLHFDFINDYVLSKIYKLLNSEKRWNIFIQSFNDVYEEDHNKAFKGKIISGGNPGLYTIYESILMVSFTNEIWGAYLYNEKIYYFSTVKNKLIPQEILSWKSRFNDVLIEYL